MSDYSRSFTTKINSLPPDLREQVMKFIDSLLTNREKAGVERVNKSGFGVLKGKIHMADDFDAPMVDFDEYQ